MYACCANGLRHHLCYSVQVGRHGLACFARPTFADQISGTEYVLTYTRYLTNAATLFRLKGANVIISSATPDNVWETGNYTYSANRFVGYAKDAAKELAAIFIDHGQTTANAYKKLGAQTVDSFYPHDHTHTSPAGAEVVAKAFVTGLEGTRSELKRYVQGYQTGY